MSDNKRHHSLPQGLTDSELATWIHKNAKEKFTDTIKKYYTPEEIREFEHESSTNGRIINRLNAILKQVQEAIKKGTDTELTVIIPSNHGTKLYDSFRMQNDDLIDKGYEEIPTEVYGIVNSDNEVLEFFTLAGENVEIRTRPLSQKEKSDYLLNSHLNSDLNDDNIRLYIDSSFGLKAEKNKDNDAKN